MNNLLEYKGYHAKLEYSAEDKIFVGHVVGINDSLVFDGETVAELECMFHDNIDDYLCMCSEIGKEADKEYKGSFNVRIPPELHKTLALEAESKGISLNQLVFDAIRHEIDGYPISEKTIVIMPPQIISDYVACPEGASKSKLYTGGSATCKTLNASYPIFAS